MVCRKVPLLKEFRRCRAYLLLYICAGTPKIEKKTVVQAVLTARKANQPIMILDDTLHILLKASRRLLSLGEKIQPISETA